MDSKVVLIVLAAVIGASTACVPKDCDSLSNLKDECVDYCINDVWKKTELSAAHDEDTVCKMCTGMIEAARKVLLRGEEGVEAVITEICAIIPFAETKERCFLYTGMGFEKLRKILISDLQPQTICSLTRMCGSTYLDNLLTIYQSNGEECQKCLRITEGAKHTFVKMGMQEFATRAVQTCRDLGPYTDACSTLIFENVEPAFTVMPMVLGDGTACLQQRVCDLPRDEDGRRIITPPEGALLALPGEKGNNEVCDYCEDIVQGWRDWLLTNKTETEFKDFLEKVCSELGVLDEQCKDLVDSYYVVAFEWINHNLKPDKVCKTIGLCKSSLQEMPMNVWPILLSGEPQIIPASKLEEATLVEENSIPATELVEATPVKNLQDSDVRRPLQENEIKTGKDEAFSYLHDTVLKPLPKAQQPDWGFLVEPLPSEPKQPLIHVPLFRETLDPSILPRGKSGGNSEKLPESPIFQQDPMTAVLESIVPEPTLDNGDKCVMCENVLHFLQRELMDRQTETEIKAAVDKICDVMPDSLRKGCLDFVNEYGDIVITLLAQNIDPSQVCPFLRLCPGDAPPLNVELATPTVPQVETKTVAEDNCVLCVYAMEELIRILEDQKTEDDIRKTLDKVCSLIPGPKLVARCRNIVDNYVQEIIDTVLIGMTPKEICTYIKLCKAEHTPLEFPIALPIQRDPIFSSPEAFFRDISPSGNEIENVEDPDKCEICELMLHMLEHQIDPAITGGKIILILMNEVCPILPEEAWREPCKKMVVAKGKEIIAYIEKKIDPKTICKQIGFCPQDIEFIHISMRFPVMYGRPPPQPIQALPFVETKPKSQSSDICYLCQIVMRTIEDQLKQKPTREEVEDVLRNVCSYLPSQIKPDCQGFVNEYFNMLVEFLESMPPSEVCRALKLCQSKGHETLSRCDVCKMSVEFLDHVLQDSRIEEDITRVVEKACSYLPGGRKRMKQCHSILEKDGPYILYLISSKAGKDEICRAVKQCKDKKGVLADICYQGPEVYCETKIKAKMCKKEKFCRKNFWLKNQQVFLL